MRFLAGTIAVASLLYGATFLTHGRASGEWLSRDTVPIDVMLERRRPVAEPNKTVTPVGKAVSETTGAMPPDQEAAAPESSAPVAPTPRKREAQPTRARHTPPAPAQVQRVKPTARARMAEPVQFGLANRG